MTKLVNGLIPKFTACPYKQKCGDYAKNWCIHDGTAHPVDFSCAMTRLIEITAGRKT